MSHYWLYYLDSDGRLERILPLGSNSDAEAIAVVFEHFRDGRAIELWAGSRLVKQFSPA